MQLCKPYKSIVVGTLFPTLNCAEPNDIATFVNPCQRRNLTTNQNPI